jgi:hypothetical protein
MSTTSVDLSSGSIKFIGAVTIKYKINTHRQLTGKI